MGVLVDGWMVLEENFWGIIIFFTTVLGLGYATSRAARLNKLRARVPKVLLYLEVGCFSLIWISIVLVLLERNHMGFLDVGSRFLSLITTLYLLVRAIPIFISTAPARVFERCILPVGVFGFILLVRLAFVSQIILPPYDDSPEHFMIIREMLNPHSGMLGSLYSIASIGENYYHLGFHSLTAWWVAASSMEIAQAMVVLGQIFIVLSAVGIVHLTTVLTKNLFAGATAGFVAVLAWRMPAFAANWGKYPALAGVALLAMGLGLLAIIIENRADIRGSIPSFLVIVGGMVMVHTRLFVCVVIFTGGYLLAKKFHREFESQISRAVIFSGTMFIFWMFKKPLLALYLNGDIYSLIVPILLLAFAVASFQRIAIGVFSATFGLWIALRIPVWFEGYGPNLLNMQFLELILFLPLSLLMGLGIAGLMNCLRRFPRPVLVMTAALVSLMLVVLNPSDRSLYPDKCCNYVGRGDLSAIQWLTVHSAKDAVVWIPAFKPGRYMIGTDAGVWVFPLTGRNANKLPYDYDWLDPGAKGKICATLYREVFIYQGSVEFSFKEAVLKSVEWADLVHIDGNTRIFRAACR